MVWTDCFETEIGVVTVNRNLANKKPMDQFYVAKKS